MSKRQELRRQQREDQKCDGPLTRSQIVKLNAQRMLPHDHPTAHKSYATPTDPMLALQAIDVLEESGVVPYISRWLRNHPGKISELSIWVALLSSVLAAFTWPSYRRTDLCSVIAGLDAQIAYRLGLCCQKTRKIISYGVVAEQCRRIEQALEEGWFDEDGTECNQNWYVHNLLRACISPSRAKQFTACVIDSTFLTAWAVPFRYADGEKPPKGKRSVDDDATFSHHSATNKRKAGLDLGFDLHIISARRTANWKGRTASANLGDPIPPVPLHMILVPAGTDPASVGVEAIEWAKKLAPNLDEVVADRGYTEKGERFNRVLHQKLMHTVMDSKKYRLKKVEPLVLGRHEHELFENCGTFFGGWLDESLKKPPEGLTGKKLTKWFDDRAICRYSPVEILANGDIRFACPQCCGRIRSNLKPRNPKVKVNKIAPFIVRTDGAEYCCPGRVTIPVKELDRYQPIPFGTTAWKEGYSRRNQIENLNGILKGKGGLDDDWCRAPNLAPRFLGAVALAVAFFIGENKQDWLNDNQCEVLDALNGDDPEPVHDESTPHTQRHETTERSGDIVERSRDGPPP